MSELPEINIRMRLLIISILMVLVGFGIVIHSLFEIQIVNGEFYQQRAISQQLRTVSINANRGTIYDRNGEKLASSATVWTVLFSPADITDAEAEVLADGLSEILGVDRDFVVEKAKDKKNYYQIVKRKVEKDVADQVIAFAAEHNIKGVTLEEDTKRYYPYGSLASSLLGFTNADNQGAYGLEAYYNSVLSGTPGKVVSAKNAWGTDMKFRYQDMYEAQDGNSIVLTIDATVQQILERHLETAVVEHGVKNRAAGIVMDVNTGAILAMSTKPDFDPNEPLVIADTATREYLESIKETDTYAEELGEAQFLQWNNKCISEPYEPGSVFKIVTLSAGLETGAATLDSHYYCPGYHIVGNVKKSCWKTAGHGEQTLAQAVQNSCNPAFMTIGQALGGERFFEYFSNFGLTGPTGIDLPGEAEGIYHSKERLTNPNDYENSLTSASFGQTFKVTPIQMITAVAAAVNGGYLYEPYVVQQVQDKDGNVISVTEPTVRRQVISEETSKLVCQMLEGVVTDGSGKNAYIPGYRIGGKTGTSEKIDTGDESKYILSFVGVAPMDDPQVAVLVLLDEPSLTNAYGSTIAAPVVGAVFADILPYLGIEKKYNEREIENLDVTVPYVIGQTPHNAQSDITQLKLNSKIMGSGGTVLSQIPAAGSQVPKGGTVILYTDEESQQERIIVPDVVGKSGFAANKLILNAGLNIKVTGVGIESTTAVAAKQSIPPGTEVPRGTVITVDFADSDLHDSF